MVRLFGGLASPALSCMFLGSTVRAQQLTSLSTTIPPYVNSHLQGVEFTSILTVDDGVTIPKRGSNGTDTTELHGTPDGLGAFDGARVGEPDFFYLAANHKFGPTEGGVREHGAEGAFVSLWKVHKETLEVVEGDDLIKEVFAWDFGSMSYDTCVDVQSFNRMCSADLPPQSALFNTQTGLGTEEIIYFNGEETAGGRAFGTVVTGPDAGKAYELAHLGYASFENVVVSPTEQDATVAILTDDSSNGEVYVYVGMKRADGLDVEKAGMVGGSLYSIAVPGKPYEIDDILSKCIQKEENFLLKLIGSPDNHARNGTDVTARGLDTASVFFADQEFESLKFYGPEDGAWDTRPGFETDFYFVTKGGYKSASQSNNRQVPTRIYMLKFNSIEDPTLGGTMKILWEDLGSIDNMAVDGGKIYIQEDLGGFSTLSRILEYDISTGQIEEIAAFDGEIFYKGGSNFLTSNEESTGIINLRDILGEGYFAASFQVHTTSKLSDPAQLVEHGQLAIMKLATNRESDLLRLFVVNEYSMWDYRVDGQDPGMDWNAVGFTVEYPWNTSTSGVETGPGKAPIGYGEDESVLNLNVGQPETPRPAAAFFRHAFDLMDPANVIGFELWVRADDGAVVYINGAEITRFNVDANTDVTFDTFASEGGNNNERDWVQLFPSCDAELALLETGNVLALSVHQDEPTSSDIRMDAVLVALYASPDGGDAPMIPSGLNATEATFDNVTLTWEAESAKTFQIERQAEGDLVWGVLVHDVPGTFTTFVDEDITGAVTFSYRISAMNVHGRSQCSMIASITVPMNPLPSIFEEDFEENNSFGQFTLVDVAGPDRGWEWFLLDTGGTVRGNGYGGLTPTDDWLITTNPINFDFYTSPIIQYDAQQSFSGPPPEVLFSADYDPAIHTNPNNATWTVINSDLSKSGSLSAQGPFDIAEIAISKGYIAFRYQSTGGGGGQSSRFTLDDIIVLANCGYDFEGFGNVGDTPGPWEVFNLGSDFGWLYAAVGGMVGATNNNFGSPDGNAAHDWLVSPPFAVVDDATFINFMYYERFGDAGVPPPLTVLITNDYSGDVETSVWTDVTPDGLDGSTSDAWIEVKTATLPIQGNSVVVAFVYQASTVGGGGTKRIGVDHICIDKIQGPLTAAFMYSRVGGVITARSTISGGTLPYTYNWNNGDDVVSDEANPVFIYTEPGTFMLTAGVTDGAGVQVMETLSIEITSLKVPEQTSDVRIATFNAAFSNVVSGSGNLSERMKTTDYVRFQLIADVIQRANPDVLFLNEFDHVWTAAGEFDEAMTLQSVEDFKTNYLEVAQTSGNVPAIYDHVFVAPCNTGIPSGYDFNNDGVVDDCCDDAFGFGEFPGQYAMVFLSKYPIVEDNIRTFQKFLWKDMPDSFLPPDPSDTDGNGDLENYYNVTEQQVYRLSSKSHWDIPVDVNGNIIHCLMSHPTPPVFDDGTATKYPSDTVADWNGLRNHDEIRFWADYVNPEINEYFYDDAEWQAAGNMTPAKRMGGLMRGGECDRFVILGDQNADPVDGDATFNPILLLLDSAMVDAETTPISQGALEQVPSTMTDTATKTANFNLRADYALPSIVGFELEKSFVFWPENADLESYLLASSDHRLVAVDVNLIDLAASCSGTMPTAAPVTMAPVESPMDDASGSNRFVGIGFIPTLIMAVTFVFASM